MSFFQSHTGFVYDVKACFAFMKHPRKIRYTKFLLFKCCMKIRGSLVQDKQVSVTSFDDFTVKVYDALVHSGCGVYGQFGCIVTEIHLNLSGQH